MLTNDHYIAMLEKRAAENDGDAIPTYCDQREQAVSEYERTLSDSKDYLGSLFTNTGKIQKYQDDTVRRLFPGTHKGSESGNPLLKVASRQAFLQALEQTEFMKTASPMYLELSYRSFCDELEKIAGPQQTLAQVAAKNRAAMQRPAKVWDLTAGSVGGGAMPRAGTGTTLNRGGILGRLGFR